MGDPVSNLLYLKPLAILSRDFVRLALWFLIVVDSSIAIHPTGPSAPDIHSPATWPLRVEYDSTFMTKIVSPSNGSLTDRISSCCFLLGEATHRITLCGTSSDMCSGISLVTQFRYTPFGAIINANFIRPARYSIPRLSSRTFDLPVPISINSANSILSHPLASASS